MVSLLEAETLRKPHLRLAHRVWSCSTYQGQFFVIGYGYTPKEAYDDWRKQQ